MSDPYGDLMHDETPEGEKARRLLSNEMSQTQRNGLDFVWTYNARKEQLAPPGDWRVWMIMAGRGFGKTRSGAEWVRMIADENPHARIALVSASLAEARAVMVEGESGLLAIGRRGHKPIYEPSSHRIQSESACFRSPYWRQAVGLDMPAASRWRYATSISPPSWELPYSTAGEAPLGLRSGSELEKPPPPVGRDHHCQRDNRSAHCCATRCRHSATASPSA